MNMKEYIKIKLKVKTEDEGLHKDIDNIFS